MHLLNNELKNIHEEKNNLMDNFIKPYFIGLASPLPFLLIMVGVVGGLLAWGFVGIFLGTTLLAVAYTTFFGWLERPSDD